MATTYDPALPWGGYGSPCGDLAAQRRHAVWHGRYPRTPAPVAITFPELADCRECLMCGGCEIHENCLTDWNHITWHARFASPGEPPCDERATVRGRDAQCALPAGHGGGWHMERDGNGWKAEGVGLPLRHG